jgi:hypothetical protein
VDEVEDTSNQYSKQQKLDVQALQVAIFVTEE